MIQINMLLSLPLFVQSINMVVLNFWHVHYLIVKRRKHLLGHSMNSLKPFRHPPKIIITDGDPAMAAAIRNVYSSTIHLLCTFHIGQNIVKHIKPLSVADMKTYAKVGMLS